VCAYLTQMLKLSYMLQYHRKLRRASEKMVSFTKALRMYSRPHPIYGTIYFGKEPQHSAETNEKRSGMERWKREKIKFKLSNLKIATISVSRI